MKKFFLAVMAFATIAMVGCKKDDDSNNGGSEPTPGPTPSASAPVFTADAANGEYVIAIQINGPICDGAKIAFPNASKLNETGKWSEDVNEIDYMELVTKDEEGNDFTGKNWYKVVINYPDGNLEGKPVMIIDDKFDWSYQTGDEASWTVLENAENVEITKGFSNESDLKYLLPGYYALVSNYWKEEVDPCNLTIYPSVVFTLDASNVDWDALPAEVQGLTPYIHGNFDGWTEGHEMTDNGNHVYTFTYSEVANGCPYQFTLGGDWNFKAIYTDASGECSGENFKVASAEEEQIIDKFDASCPKVDDDDPIDTPVEEAYFIKHPWGTGADADWTWEEMTEAEDGTYTYAGLWGGVGANINTTAADGGAWYPKDNIEGAADLNVGDEVVFVYNVEEKTLSIQQ